ncbi:anti-sigma regulatory factor [Candidatus Lucifugimonas marina]|uniref:Anti-sigma regulatory factor n=1 Tax=Candidatus Lucifugimonas marina TaxID=3038979 RepID=A0AAJ5ZGM1_9CHLR|nr:anti-sigma regulatory factor [SAR202 cluster bacterium JH702]MDG0869728.1 anti-sigma regulatory factor [SAR202 cluster bacterium JH639]WFG34457.1 anti-sigma regulatory factor [SAR202 cluster bacterium JH545]WFG38386.1 anti-sigma regulatory factor [SAR202 cluster bacterium JH1073]
MTTITPELIRIVRDTDVVTARRYGRDMAKKIGFGSADQTRLATAISELTRNVIKYADNGECLIYDESNESCNKIRVVVEDHGPGIPDIETAMADGYTTGGTLGAGLPGTRRLVNEFNISSEPGHTRVEITMEKQVW